MGSNDRSVDAASLSRSEILEDVKLIIADQIAYEANKMKETDSLVDDLGCDSLDRVEIIMRVEEEFDISVPDEVADLVRTVGDVADKVAEQIAH